jgi:hypothetical protein
MQLKTNSTKTWLVKNFDKPGFRRIRDPNWSVKELGKLY